MIKYTIWLILGVICLSTITCVDAIDLKTEEEKKLLVVEGYITTQSGPHYIKLSTSAKYGSNAEGSSLPLTGARIYIKDNVGEQVFLTEDFPGRYRTNSDFKAEVGRSYSMIINTGKAEYISSPEEVVPVPKLEASFAEYAQTQLFFDNSVKSGVNFYVSFNDPLEEQNLMFFSGESVYEFNTRPDLFRVGGGESGPGFVVPKPCCDKCWRSEERPSSKVSLYNDNLTDGNAVTKLAWYVNDDGLRFQNKYMIVLGLNSLTREAFQYYDILDAQLSISGEIFDPPPANVGSNFININDPGEQVIGFFHASDRSIDTLFIEPDFLQVNQSQKQINDDCREVFNSSATRPSFW